MKVYTESLKTVVPEPERDWDAKELDQVCNVETENIEPVKTRFAECIRNSIDCKEKRGEDELSEDEDQRDG